MAACYVYWEADRGILHHNRFMYFKRMGVR